MTKVKLCGMRRVEDILIANEVKPDFVGFIFAPNRKRTITHEQAALMKKALDPSIPNVGVFINNPLEEVVGLYQDGIIDHIQLHGTEDDQYIAELKRRLSNVERVLIAKGEEAEEQTLMIKAFQVTSMEDIERANGSTADLVLLDSGNGGTGESFDWSLLQHVSRPYILAGGLTPDNVAHAVNALHPYAVDTSSGTETDGIKSASKMKKFVEEVRRVDK